MKERRWTFDESSGTVSVAGISVNLTPTEALFFGALDRIYPRAGNRSYLMGALYDHTGGEEPDVKMLDVLVYLVRRKLAGALPVWVETVWGVGYRLSETKPRRRAPRFNCAGPVIQARADVLLALLRQSPGRVVPTPIVEAALAMPEREPDGHRTNALYLVVEHLRKQGRKVWHARAGDVGGYFLEAEPAPKLELVKVSA